MKLLHTLLCLSVLLFVLTGCGEDMENTLKVQNDLTEAQREAQIGQTAQARLWCDRAIAVRPRSVGTYVYSPTDDNPAGLGIAALGAPDNGVFSSIGDDPDTIAYMKRARAALPDDERPLLILDQAYGMQGDTADQRAAAAAAAALLEKKLKTPGSTRDESLMLFLSQAYFDAGDPVKGATDGQAVIQAFPKDPGPYNELAYMWAVADSKPDLPQARADAQRAVTMATSSGLPDEDVSEFQDTLAWVQYRQGDYADALGNAQAAVSVDPREPEERYHLGMIYAALHEPDAARAELSHAASLEPGYAAAQSALAALPPSS